jgi:Family of unknown function (DUF6168)
MIQRFKFLLISVAMAVFSLVLLGLYYYQFYEVMRIDHSGVIFYFFFSSVLIIGLMEFLMEKIALNASYVYLLTIVLKVGFFMLIFNTRVFSVEHLTGLEKSAIIVPMFVFLGIEAFYLMKKMND